MAGGALHVACLVVEEEVGFELAQELALGRPPRNIASSTSMSHCISVRIARSCAGALRAVTSAVRIVMPSADARRSCCRAVSKGLNGPAARGVEAWAVSWSWKASRPSRWKTRSASSENSTASPSKAIRTSFGCASEARAEWGNTRAAGTPASRAERTSCSFVDRNRWAPSGRR